MLTVAGLVSGLTALKFAFDGRWAGVIVLVTLAAVFDALDGRTARRFKTSSAFGAALDSLSDLVVFGVVPALCLYLWALQDSGRVAWWATLFYAVSIALRLPDSILNCRIRLNTLKIISPASQRQHLDFWCWCLFASSLSSSSVLFASQLTCQRGWF